MEQQHAQPVLLIGGGNGGYELIRMLQDEPLLNLVALCETEADAPASLLAKQLNITIFDDAIVALHACAPCLAFNLTKDESISQLAASILGPSHIIGGSASYLIWKMLHEVKQTHDENRQQQRLTEAIINHAMEGMLMIDAKGIVSLFNPAAESIFGYAAHEVLGQNISMLMPTPDRDQHDSYLAHYHQTHEKRVVGIEREVVAMKKDGTHFPLSLSVNEMFHQEQPFYIGIVSDITERKRKDALISRLAHYDIITDLPNRVLFFDRCAHAISHAKRQSKKMAVIFIDLDGFKAVNDTLGHVAGDELLKQVAMRLKSSVRESDTVARFGGDEFALVIDGIEQRSDIIKVAEKIIRVIGEPFTILDTPCNIGASAGIAVFPNNHTEMDSLVHQADTAMYRAKKGGKNHFRFYEPDMQPY
ncbi:MAG: diguanylate cyclase [Zetaproteobacteria bacterium]|nr:diguanylate cyclase [Zetaproteobacteria bacterium]